MEYMVRSLTACLAVLTLCIVIAGSKASGEVNVNINVGVPVPPAVVVEAPPAMIFLSQPGVYVAVDVPYYIFFVSGRYYYFHNDHWYRSHGYRGPWTNIKRKVLPPGLRKYTIHQLHDFRDREFVVYKDHGPGYKGRHFVAKEDHRSKSNKHYEKGHKKHYKGKRD